MTIPWLEQALLVRRIGSWLLVDLCPGRLCRIDHTEQQLTPLVSAPCEERWEGGGRGGGRRWRGGKV